MLMVNAMVVGVGTYAIVEQVSHKQNVGQIFTEIDKVRLLVSRYVNSLSRASAQQVFLGLDATRKKISATSQGMNDEQLRSMLPLLDDFKLNFQKYMVEADQKSALESRAAMLGQRMSVHLDEAHKTPNLRQDHQAFDAMQTQLLALQWAGQSMQSDPRQASAQLRNITQALTDLRQSSNRIQASQDGQRLLFRILRDASDYATSLDSYVRFQDLNTQTEQRLTDISDALQDSNQRVSQSVDQAIRSQISLVIGLMVLMFLLTLICAVALSKYLTREILRPIRALVGVTHDIAQGNLQARASGVVDDEIGELAGSFNNMTQSLLDKNQALLLAQQELEQRVHERTLQLAGLNESLTLEISERKLAQENLQLAASVFTHAREGIMITDAAANIVEVNEAFTRITGYARAEVIGENPRILKSNRQTPAYYAAMWKALAEKDHWYGEAWNQRKNGEIYAEMLTISVVRNAQGQAQHYVALFSDITPMKEHQQQLENIAHFDALTQLPNRLLLADRLQLAMLQCQRRQNLFAVAYLDLDGFKIINDTYGHDVGDELLVALSHSMKSVLREGDTLARIGGDEFVVVLVDLNHFSDHEPLLERLLQAACSPMLVQTAAGGVSMQVSASIGVTLYPQDNSDADLLMRHADQAMYAAKQAGKNRYRLFDVAHDTAIKIRMESLEHIVMALNRGEFLLHYQPKVNLANSMITGAEALIRWQHPERGLLFPDSFLPAVEGHPVSIAIGEWVIANALAQMRTWQAQGLSLSVSVNIGGRQLQQEGFAARLGELLSDCPEISPQQLQLEVLESSALEDLAKVSAAMIACQSLGVSFALDDFGTGYSSLTYLRRLPAGTLKIDQSFVRDMREDPNDLAIVNGVIGLAKAFDRKVIAEGVETAAHGQLLLSMGCVLAQGYGIARPMPAGSLPGWISSWHAQAVWTA